MGKWAGVDEKPPKRILDVGCGIGGSSRHIAAKYGKDTVTGVGITLSPVQAARASTISAAPSSTRTARSTLIE